MWRFSRVEFSYFLYVRTWNCTIVLYTWMQTRSWHSDDWFQLAMTLWHCYDIMTLLWHYNNCYDIIIIATTLWHCYDIVTLLWRYDIALRLWHCYDVVTLLWHCVLPIMTSIWRIKQVCTLVSRYTRDAFSNLGNESLKLYQVKNHPCTYHTHTVTLSLLSSSCIMSCQLRQKDLFT